MGILGFANSIFGAAKKVVNKDSLEAIVAGSMLVAAADGEIEAAEIKKVEQLIAFNENLSAFSRADIAALVTKYGALLEVDFHVGRAKMLKEIEDVASSPEKAEEVFLNMLAVAKSDGEIEPAERAVLRDIGSRLGVNVGEYGV